MDYQYIVYLVDEQSSQRRANCLVLTRLLSDPLVKVKIEAIAPYENLSQYDHLLAQATTAAFIIDQKLHTTGEADYEGTKLASHLRAINTKLPLYILTNYPDDAKQKGENTVEDVIDKRDLINDKAKNLFKARFLRRIAVYRDVLSAREQEFHDLLVKGLNGSLSNEERAQLDLLKAARRLPLQAADMDRIAQLNMSIDKLKSVLALVDRPKAATPAKRKK